MFFLRGKRSHAKSGNTGQASRHNVGKDLVAYKSRLLRDKTMFRKSATTSGSKRFAGLRNERQLNRFGELTNPFPYAVGKQA